MLNNYVLYQFNTAATATIKLSIFLFKNYEKCRWECKQQQQQQQQIALVRNKSSRMLMLNRDFFSSSIIELHKES